MTLDDLKAKELSLMRVAFEKACAIAGLSIETANATDEIAYAQIASTVQNRVERGASDLNEIARQAAESIAKGSSLIV